MPDWSTKTIPDLKATIRERTFEQFSNTRFYESPKDNTFVCIVTSLGNVICSRLGGLTVSFNGKPAHEFQTFAGLLLCIENETRNDYIKYQKAQS